jgi:hypothetical protein
LRRVAALCVANRWRQSLHDALMPKNSGRGTNRIISLCLLCLFVGGVEACRPHSSSDVSVAPEIAPQPPRAGQVTLTMRVTDASGRPLTGARIKLEGNMTHAGMVPAFADATEIDPGRYRANLELSMAGDWFVVVHLTLPDGSKVDRQFEIKGVAPA